MMRTIWALIRRNQKLFFKDKGMFISSMITPIILIVLYATFLFNVYKDSFVSSIPDFIHISKSLINGTVAAQLCAALLAVSCVTVTFCVNLTMVQDKANGVRKDFDISPISKSTLYLGYLGSTILTSILVNFVTLAMCLLYIYKMGWYLSGMDVLYLLFDMILIVVFGALLSSVLCFPLKTQGQMSAVGTIVSAGYGFLCGAYMPISNFSKGLQNFLSYLPSTYGTSLLKNHMLRGIFVEMKENGFPKEVVNKIKYALDCNPTFQGAVISTNTMIYILLISIVISFVLYLCIVQYKKK